MFNFLLKKKLSAYIDGELDEKTSAKITSLINSDESFRTQYELLKNFIENSGLNHLEDLPYDPWDEIQARIKDYTPEISYEKKARRYFYQNNFVRFSTVMASLLLILMFIQYPTDSSDGTIKLNEYISNIENNINDTQGVVSAFMDLPDNFKPGDLDLVLRSSFLVEGFENSPFNNFDLKSQALIKYKDLYGTQLVFAEGDKVFSIYVVRNLFKFDFEERGKRNIDINGLNIEQIESPNTNIYFYDIGEIAVAMISSFSDEELTGNILKYFKDSHTNASTLNNNFPHISSDGNLILFTSFKDGNGEIYRMDSDGNNLQRLTNNKFNDSDASISPNGEKIIYQSDSDGDSDLYLMNINGTEQIKITHNDTQDMYPAWSQDGSNIVYISEIDGLWEVFVMDADGNNISKVTDLGSYSLYPSWFPNNSKIIFNSMTSAGSDIFIGNPFEHNYKQITNNEFVDFAARISPDGESIAFTSNRNGYYDIYVMDITGKLQKRLTNNSADNGYPAWSPSGEKIYFSSNRSGYWELFEMDNDGNNQIRLTN